MIWPLIKEDRELHRYIDKLSRQRVGAALCADGVSLRSLDARSSIAPPPLGKECCRSGLAVFSEVFVPKLAAAARPGGRNDSPWRAPLPGLT
jgi:hypothetical protein